MQNNSQSSQQVKETPEQVKKRKTLVELRLYATQERDDVGLLGHQPTLVRIREAYKSGKCTDQELTVLLEALYAKTQGHEEPFESAKAFYKYMFPTRSLSQPKPELTQAEQAAKIAAILGDTVKKTPKKKSKPKKAAPKIDASLLPAHLRQFM